MPDSGEEKYQDLPPFTLPSISNATKNANSIVELSGIEPLTSSLRIQPEQRSAEVTLNARPYVEIPGKR